MEHRPLLERAFQKAGLQPTSDFLDRAAGHLAEVYRWNKVHDLTAVEEAEAAERHTLDSILPFAGMTAPDTLLDVGSGAGFPGIPLALWWPSARVTLLEPLRKRRSFLENTCARLGIDATVRGEAVEKLKGLQFDLVTSRATLPWSILLSACAPCVRPGGRLMGLLGPEQAPSPGELRSLQGSTWNILELRHYSLPSGAARTVLLGQRH
ncbi:MAG: 16S rRNA (guanine(527)-N(7))-methyltransferase RsmG [Myxococcota bacterium]